MHDTHDHYVHINNQSELSQLTAKYPFIYPGGFSALEDYTPIIIGFGPSNHNIGFNRLSDCTGSWQIWADKALPIHHFCPLLNLYF